MDAVRDDAEEDAKANILGSDGGGVDSIHSLDIPSTNRSTMGCSICSSSSRTMSSEGSPSMSSRMGLRGISSHSSMVMSRCQMLRL